MQKFVGNIFILLGIFLILFSGYMLWERQNPNRLKFDNYMPSSRFNLENDQVSSPIRLEIKDLGINLPIVPANRNEKYWETTSEGVSYLTSSPIPGQIGNSIFYGHNWASLLGKLTKAKPGQNITIYYEDGSVKVFPIKYTQTVKPNQTEILGNTEDKRITLYTCSGFLDRERFVVTAIFE